MLVYGILVMIVFIIIHVAIMAYNPLFAMNHAGMFLNAFLVGAIACPIAEKIIK